jgi:hypothetical protein
MTGFRDVRGRFVKGVTNPWQFAPGMQWTTIRELFQGWTTILRHLSGPRGTRLFGHMIIEMDPEDYREMMRQARRLQDTRDAITPALREIGVYLTEVVVPRMFEEGDATGVGGMSTLGWDDLKDSTNKWRAEHDFPQEHPILIASGALYNEITSHSAIHIDSRGRMPRVYIGGSDFSSPEREKFYVHMGGGTGWQGSEIPPRPFVPTSEDDLTREEKNHIDDIFKQHLEHYLEI